MDSKELVDELDSLTNQVKQDREAGVFLHPGAFSTVDSKPDWKMIEAVNNQMLQALIEDWRMGVREVERLLSDKSCTSKSAGYNAAAGVLTGLEDRIFQYKAAIASATARLSYQEKKVKEQSGEKRISPVDMTPDPA